MADQETRRGGEPGESLLQRLEEQIQNLERIEVAGLASEQLQEAIDNLRKEADDLRRIAPHIFVFVPRR